MSRKSSTKFDARTALPEIGAKIETKSITDSTQNGTPPKFTKSHLSVQIQIRQNSDLDLYRDVHSAAYCNTLQQVVTHSNTLQHTATHCDTLQYTATHCNTLQINSKE